MWDSRKYTCSYLLFLQNVRHVLSQGLCYRPGALFPNLETGLMPSLLSGLWLAVISLTTSLKRTPPPRILFILCYSFLPEGLYIVPHLCPSISPLSRALSIFFIAVSLDSRLSRVCPLREVSQTPKGWVNRRGFLCVIPPLTLYQLCDLAELLPLTETQFLFLKTESRPSTK